MMAKRDYAKEYREYHAKPEQKRNRAKRNAARRLMEEELGKAAIKGKDIDHKMPLSKGGSNARSNLRVMSVRQNRGRNNRGR